MSKAEYGGPRMNARKQETADLIRQADYESLTVVKALLAKWGMTLVDEGAIYERMFTGMILQAYNFGRLRGEQACDLPHLRLVQVSYRIDRARDVAVLGSIP